MMLNYNVVLVCANVIEQQVPLHTMAVRHVLSYDNWKLAWITIGLLAPQRRRVHRRQVVRIYCRVIIYVIVKIVLQVKHKDSQTDVNGLFFFLFLFFFWEIFTYVL